MGRLAGKSVIISGAGSGIGRAFALALAAEGAKVGVLDLNEAAAQNVVDSINGSGGGAILSSAAKYCAKFAFGAA